MFLLERVGVCLSCHQELPHGRFVYRVISKVGDSLGMIPKTDADHKKLIGKAMFIAANVQIFGPIIGALLVLLILVLVVRRKKPAN